MTSTKAPESYGAAITQAQALIRAGRLNDEAEHFPYKHEHATALIAENPPAGPDGPDDDSVRVVDVLSQRIADATSAYVTAQEAYLRDPGDGTRAEYEHARDTLQLARRSHRRDRVDSNGNPTVIINGKRG